MARLGLSGRQLDVADEIVRVAADAGDLTLVYPLGEAVVGQAINHVASGERWGEIDPVIVGAVRGEFGRPRGAVSAEVRAAADAAPESEPTVEAEMADAPAGLADEDKLLWAMFPQAAERLFERRGSLTGETAVGMPVGVDRTLIETLVDVVEGSTQAEVSVRRRRPTRAWCAWRARSSARSTRRRRPRRRRSCRSATA